MSTFNRLFGLAAKALDKSASPSSPPSSAQPGAGAPSSTDWRSLVRSAADALTGDAQSRPSTTPPPAPGAARPDVGAPAAGAPAAGVSATAAGAPSAADRAAIARYDYLMQTADPHQVERIHQEAFARLTPAQRAQIEARMRAELPPYEQPASPASADLARAAARSEAMQPGRMRGLLARAGGATAVAGAGVAAGGLLGMVAGGAIASAVAAPLLAQAADFGVDFDAIAQGIDMDAIAQGIDLDAVTGGAMDAAGEQLSGVGEQVSGFGDALSDFGIPGLGDLFGR